MLSHALYILAARPNTASMRPYIPKKQFGHEFEEEDGDDECY